MKKHYKQPDLNAPRHKLTRLAGANDKFYAAFFKKHPKYKGVISNQDIKKIIVTFNQNIKDVVVNERDGAEFPEQLGYCFVGSCMPMKGHNPNRAQSFNHEVDIQHTNLNSDGLVAKIFYTNYATKYKFKMRELWTFKGCRVFKRAVSASYRENWKSYMMVDDFMTIRNMYNKARNREYAKKMAKDYLKDYNEFDMN